MYVCAPVVIQNEHAHNNYARYYNLLLPLLLAPWPVACDGGACVQVEHVRSGSPLNIHGRTLIYNLRGRSVRRVQSHPRRVARPSSFPTVFPAVTTAETRSA